MTKVERENGYVEDSELDGNTVITVTIEGIHPTNPDQLDRVLQYVLIDMGIDTAWQQPPPVEVNPVVLAEPSPPV